MLKALSLVCLIVLGNTAIGSEPITVFSGEGERTPKQPQACIDSQGVVHLTFGVGEDVHFCTIMPDGIIDQKSSIRIPNMSLGMRRGPRIALSQDSVVITVIGGPQGKGRDGDILSYRSIDGGKNWFGPVKVNDVDDSAREGLHAMAASDDGICGAFGWICERKECNFSLPSRSIKGLHGARINWCIGRKVEAFASVVILRFWPTRTRCMSCSETRSRVTETCILFPPKIAERVLVPRFAWDRSIGS